jgi:hypothetical protein
MYSETALDLWPLHPMPYPEEVFSGWLARINRAHGLAPWRFVRELRRRARAREHDVIGDGPEVAAIRNFVQASPT